LGHEGGGRRKGEGGGGRRCDDDGARREHNSGRGLWKRTRPGHRAPQNVKHVVVHNGDGVVPTKPWCRWPLAPTPRGRVEYLLRIDGNVYPVA
jgi:hypothetical protein